jgi:hypothetical protein
LIPHQSQDRLINLVTHATLENIMKGLYILILASFMATACGDSTPPADTTPSPTDTLSDSGKDVAVADTQTPEDTTPQDSDEPDAPAEPDVDTQVGPTDGLLGSPCTESSDCVQSPEHTCFAGFCTTRCWQDGEQNPAACGGVSSQSILGDEWGCPDDLIYCMPAVVSGQNIICSADYECSPFGKEFHCAAVVLLSNMTVDGICLPTGNDGAATGTPCQEATECQSWFCMGSSSENEGTCADHCFKNSHCPEGNLCIGTGFLTNDSPDEAAAWAGVCVAVEGSLTYCTSQAKCPDDEFCDVSIEPSSLVPQYWCEAGNAGGKAFGETCSAASDCASGRCMFGTTEAATSYCTQTCQKDPADCPGDYTCGALSLHNNGTPGVYDDDMPHGLCVKSAEGEHCSTNAQSWCAEGLECKSLASTPEWLGLCTTPLGCADEGGPSCDDGLACTENTCAANQCDFTLLTPATCLINGSCYAAGDALVDNSCQLCDPDTASDQWSPAPDGPNCLDGQPVDPPVADPEPDVTPSDADATPEDTTNNDLPEDAGPDPVKDTTATPDGADAPANEDTTPDSDNG